MDKEETDYSVPEFPNDRDYFVGNDGNIYQVMGYVHERDKIYSFQKYVRVEGKYISDIMKNIQNLNGYRLDGKKEGPLTAIDGSTVWYSKLTGDYYIRAIERYTSPIIKENISTHKYTAYSKLYGMEMLMFPRKSVKYYFSPRERTYAILKTFDRKKLGVLGELDVYERTVLEVILAISGQTGIDPYDIGITGSILWKGAHKYSDIDIIIYGQKNTFKFLNNVDNLIENDRRFRKPGLTEMMELGEKMAAKTGLPPEECIYFISVRKFPLYFEDTFLSISFCPNDDEIMNNPFAGENTSFKKVEKAERITIRATLLNEDWLYFYPSLALLGDPEPVDVPEGIEISEPLRLVLYEKDCIGYYKKGDRIEVRGMLQKVINPPPGYRSMLLSYMFLRGIPSDSVNIDKTHQIIVGTFENFGDEYVKPNPEKAE